MALAPLFRASLRAPPPNSEILVSIPQFVRPHTPHERLA
jgi:hypothetical protein